MAQSRRRPDPPLAPRLNRAPSARLARDAALREILRDDRRGRWILVCPASSFIEESVEERRPDGKYLRSGERWTAVDALLLGLIATFYSALGYVLWQLGS